MALTDPPAPGERSHAREAPTQGGRDLLLAGQSVHAGLQSAAIAGTLMLDAHWHPLPALGVALVPPVLITVGWLSVRDPIRAGTAVMTDCGTVLGAFWGLYTRDLFVPEPPAGSTQSTGLVFPMAGALLGTLSGFALDAWLTPRAGSAFLPFAVAMWTGLVSGWTAMGAGLADTRFHHGLVGLTSTAGGLALGTLIAVLAPEISAERMLFGSMLGLAGTGATVGALSLAGLAESDRRAFGWISAGSAVVSLAVGLLVIHPGATKIEAQRARARAEAVALLPWLAPDAQGGVIAGVF